ncbi:MAG: UDP-N-acetyl-D-glucosamine dehydrogenase, partial [Bacteroidetes bacterium]|nr:UDP-N-acetyl-D-glucosamine dehydrogenase [Bacteroidota bacterium]
MTSSELLRRIESSEVTVGVMGLGYVGLPLAVEFAKAKIRTLGFEKSQEKALRVNDASNYISDVSDQDLRIVVENKTLQATTDFQRLKECDAIIICVPTPLDRFKKPDMSFIDGACKDIGRYMK